MTTVLILSILSALVMLVAGILLSIGICQIVGKIEETHKTVLWIKDKLNHDT